MTSPDADLVAKLAEPYAKDLDEARRRAMKLRAALEEVSSERTRP
ncbi:hypothetical protein [Taklimakanibacter deserti]